MFAIGADFSQWSGASDSKLRHAFLIGLAKMLLAERFRLSLNMSLVLAHGFARVFIRLLALLLAIEMAVLRIWIRPGCSLSGLWAFSATRSGGKNYPPLTTATAHALCKVEISRYREMDRHGDGAHLLTD
jgi:hypothetical protein